MNKYFMSFVTVIFLAFLFFACDNENGSKKTTYTVTFDADGGRLIDDNTSSIKINVESGGIIADLPTPWLLQDVIYGFYGWFTHKNGVGDEFTTTTKVTNDLTVYAFIRIPPFETVDNLFEEYKLVLESAQIWNDYMPGGGWSLTPDGERASICNIVISSIDPLPSMDVYTNVITDTVRFDKIPFYKLYKEDRFGIIYPNKHWRDYRPVANFRIGDGANYLMEIIVRIDGKQQIIATEGKVFVTH